MKRIVIVLEIGLLLFLLCGCGSKNYLNTYCREKPQINIFVWPQKSVNLSKSKAILFLIPPPQNFSSPWAQSLKNALWQALRQECIFQEVTLGSRFAPSKMKTLKKKGIDFVVLIDRIEYFAPTKVSPGHIILDMRVLDTKNQKDLWIISGEMDLCPKYPFDYVFHLGKGSFPHKDPYSLEHSFFYLGKALVSHLKNTNKFLEKKKSFPPFPDFFEEEDEYRTK